MHKVSMKVDGDKLVITVDLRTGKTTLAASTNGDELRKLVKLPNSRKKIAAAVLPPPAADDPVDETGQAADPEAIKARRSVTPIDRAADPDMFKARLRSMTSIDQAVDPPRRSVMTDSENRAKLPGSAASKARRQFHADINVCLSRDHGGLTIAQLADGVPLEDWWKAGLLPEVAAERCLQWRQPRER